MENRTIYNSECENKITGVNKNVITASQQEMEEDDFDRLLDEFIRESFEDNETEDDNGADRDCASPGFDDDGFDDDDEEFDVPIEDCEVVDGYEEFDDGFVNYKLGRMNYMLPVQPTEVCKASKLVLTYSSFDGEQLRGEPLAFVADDDDMNRIYFTLHGVTDYDGSIRPVMYVYEASENYPIQRFVFDMSDVSVNREGMASLESLINTIPAGNYFFYLWGVDVEGLSEQYKNNNGACFIPFVKVCSGNAVPSVSLDKLDAKVDKCSNSVNLSLRFDTMLDKRYAFSLNMYNRNYNLVAKGAAFAWDSYSTRKKKNLNVTLAAEYPLFGEYAVFIMQNGVPHYKVRMFIDDDKVVSMEFSTMRPFSQEYLMLVKLEKNSRWHIFRELSAPSTIKEYFLSVYARQHLNSVRSLNKLDAIDRVSHFIYNGGSSNKELMALDKMSGMFSSVSHFKSADCIELTEAKNSVDPYSEAKEMFEECRGECIALYNVSALVSNGSVVVKKMLEAMKSYSTLSICLIGKAGEIAQLFECYPQLKHFFPANATILPGKMYADTLVAQVIKELKKCDLVLSSQARNILVDTAKKAEAMGCIESATEATVSEYIKSGIVDNFVSRVMSELDSRRVKDRIFLSTIESCDIDRTSLLKGGEQEFEESIKQLNMMVGLDDVKKSIITNFNRLKNNAERRRLGLKVKSGECHHMIFTGNPGTGKTTVAKMMGRIYRSLGLLSKGDVVYTDRSKIVGRFIGDTEHNMQRILLEAKGNILFIDEAYTLCDSPQERKDFGYRAIECLLTVMAQEDCDMIVIFAGYAKEMEKMMQSNQGLQGRFPYKFEFKDYTAEELMQIAEYKLTQEDYELTDEARTLLRSTIDEAVDNKGWSFSNARWIEQYVNNGIIPAQSDRLIQCNSTKNRDDYRCISVEDVRTAYALCKPAQEVKRVYREIGFTA